MFEDKEGNKWKIELRYGEGRYKEVVAYKNDKIYRELKYVVIGKDKKPNDTYDWEQSP